MTQKPAHTAGPIMSAFVSQITEHRLKMPWSTEERTYRVIGRRAFTGTPIFVEYLKNGQWRTCRNYDVFSALRDVELAQ